MGLSEQLHTFMPHGMCLLWRPELLLLHIGSDAVIALAYFAIPFGIAWFVNRRSDLGQKHRALAALFAAFIALCGLTHLASILVLWYPVYVAEGWLKAVTAAVSLATAAFVSWTIPALLRLPSAEMLQREIVRHQATLSELSAARAALTQRVDLTENELRQAEQNFAQSDKLLRAVIEAAPGLIYAKDKSGRMLVANRSALELIGQPWSIVKGRSDKDFLANKRQAEVVMATDMIVMEHGKVQEIEEVVDHPSKGSRILLSTKVPLRESSGEISGIVGVSIDITDRKKFEKEAIENLEHIINEKSEVILQRDLLLREVYHRVKNNLQLIDSFLVMQGRLLVDPIAKESLKSLRKRVYSLGLVHHQLMSSDNFSTFNIAPFLYELVDNLTASGFSENTKLSVISDPVTVDLDFAIPLGLIVTELVTNALKHAFPTGDGNVEVRFNFDKVNNEIILIVRDDGIGNETKNIDNGLSSTGLGNVIIHSLVKQLRGTLVISYDFGTKVEIKIKKDPVS